MSGEWRTRTLLSNEDGMALVMAVVVMLLLLVFAVSFAIMATLEVRTGFNDLHTRQAQYLAEAGFEAVRNQLRSVGGNYSQYLGNVYTCDSGGCSCTPGPNWVGGTCPVDGLAPLTAGSFRVRVDNDPEDPGEFLSPTQDTNQQVLLTALGVSAGQITAPVTGQGRAQFRVEVISDNPWDHVCASDDASPDCANYQGDNPCTPNGISVSPCQPEDPHGPAVFPQLPSPHTIAIAPTDGRYGCINSGVGLGAGGVNGWATQWTLEGNAGNPQVIGDATASQSYFDMALSMDGGPLLSAGLVPAAPAGRNRRAYCATVGPGCADGTLDPTANPNTLGCGLVIDGNWTTPGGGGVKYVNATADAAGETSASGKVVIYVTNQVNTGNNAHMQGTLVAHGDATGGNADIAFSPRTCLNRLSNGPDCGDKNPSFSSSPRLGYPLALLLHHPGSGAGSPPPENVQAQLSSTGVALSGIIFSTGNVYFNPINVDGGVVAYGVEIQGNSQFVYNLNYGADAPPPGFDTPPGTMAAQFMRSTWVQCRQTDISSNPLQSTRPACN